MCNLKEKLSSSLIIAFICLHGSPVPAVEKVCTPAQRERILQKIAEIFNEENTKEKNYKTLKMSSKYARENVEALQIYGTKVKYYTKEERQAFQITIRDGKAYDQAGNLFNTVNATNPHHVD